MLNIKYIETEDEYQQARIIREEVFIREQNVPREIELDEHEDTATHILAVEDGQTIGTARWRYTEEGVKLERFAVPEQQRGPAGGDHPAVDLCYLQRSIDLRLDLHQLSLTAEEIQALAQIDGRCGQESV